MLENLPQDKQQNEQNIQCGLQGLTQNISQTSKINKCWPMFRLS